MFTDVMCDIETTGTNPERNAILQISAVKFNYETGEIDTNFFDRCLHVHPGREWDFDTRVWWTKQGGVLEGIQARAEDPYTVMRSFYEWLLLDWPSTRKEGRQFWAKPVTFDYPFLVSYLKMFGMDMPCHFRYARDLNSFMAGLTGTTDHPGLEEEVEFVGDTHNALHDTLFQIKILLHAKSRVVKAEIVR